MQKVKLGEYVKIKTGKLDANAACQNGKYPFFTCSIEPLKIDKYSYDCECVLVAGNGDLNVKYYNGKFDAYQRTYIIESLDKNILSVPYLFRFLDKYVETLRTQSIGGVIKYIKLGNLTDATLYIPQLEEQNKIVKKLKFVSELIEKRKEQINKLDLLIKSRFIEMFGDPETNPHLWVVENLSMHLDVIGGYAFKSENFIESGIPVLRIGNINTGKFTANNLVFWHRDKNLDNYKILPGDLVMSLTGTVGKEDYGNVCILGDDYPEYYLNQRNAKLQLNNTLHKLYLAELFRFSSIKKRLTNINRGVRQANISNKDILDLRVPIPPIDLQLQFAAFVEKTDKVKQTIKINLDKLETLKKSLMQQYFG